MAVARPLGLSVPLRLSFTSVDAHQPVKSHFLDRGGEGDVKPLLQVQEPFSGGVLLSYKCTSECRHCMYACSPRWAGDWISEEDLRKVLIELSDRILPSPFGADRIGVNYGLHFTGGEPFLNFDLLQKAVRIAHDLQIPSTFVETNGFWCVKDDDAREKLTKLKDAGLHGILVSVNPFILEQVPFERTDRAIRIGREIFHGNLMTYQELFHNQFERLDIKGTLSFEEYMRRADSQGLLKNMELLPMGRAAYALGHLYRRYPAQQFFHESCREELTRGWHIHVDNYCNYMTGYCGGISLGDARDITSICQGIDLNKHPILNALAADLKTLFELGVKVFNYTQLGEGYISKCHLCADLRRHIAQERDDFRELRPREFYHHLHQPSTP
jgi:MoaA/NifB/PqqE/SkfB family radical SAM enzyme